MTRNKKIVNMVDIMPNINEVIASIDNFAIL